MQCCKALAANPFAGQGNVNRNAADKNYRLFRAQATDPIDVSQQRRRSVQQKRWAAISVQVSDARLYDELTGLSSSRLGRSGNALA